MDMIARFHPLIVKRIAWPDESATQAFARALAKQPAIGNALIELSGDLGAGKTTFVRHLLSALGVQGRIKSPTYAVVETYSLALPSDMHSILDSINSINISHFDFYRFNDPREWEEAGFRDIFANLGLKLVEWPEKAGEYLPKPDLQMDIEVLNDESRVVTLNAFTALGAELIA
jgi:tRNA threonylcarbamoyladenosine biosynthesis protein TsaE